MKYCLSIKKDTNIGKILDIDNLSFTIENKVGLLIVHQALFGVDSEDTGKSYIAYTDGSRSAQGDILVYADSYSIDGQYIYLTPIETFEEYKMMTTILDEYKIDEESFFDDDELYYDADIFSIIRSLANKASDRKSGKMVESDDEIILADLKPSKYLS